MKLRTLLEKATEVVVGGYDIEEFYFESPMRLVGEVTDELGWPDKAEFVINDQDVYLDEDGCCKALLEPEGMVEIMFLVTRPMTEEDVREGGKK